MNLIIVITSYSIHYTKLYDIIGENIIIQIRLKIMSKNLLKNLHQTDSKGVFLISISGIVCNSDNSVFRAFISKEFVIYLYLIQNILVKSRNL